MAELEHPARLPIDELLKACEAERFRASGPGGQHRNKVETAVRLTHRPTGITGQASERRSQAQNHTAAVFRLRVNLALSVRSPKVESEQMNVSTLWRSRTKSGRLAINPNHDDFPALLAEALDRLHACCFEASEAAASLNVSRSQLLKLLRHEPRAMELLNHHRLETGLSRLR